MNMEQTREIGSEVRMEEKYGGGSKNKRDGEGEMVSDKEKVQ